MTAPCRRTVAAFLFLVPVAAFAQERRPITGEGTEGFRALLVGKGLQPIGSFDDINPNRVDPKQVLLIAFRGADREGRPHPDLMDQLPFLPYRDFIAKGGALFVATDQAITSDWVAPFGARASERPIVASINAARYRNEIECPYAVGVTGAAPDLFVRNETDPTSPFGGNRTGSLRVATNRPTVLMPTRELDPLGAFPRATWRYIDSRSVSFEPGIFAQGRRYEGGGRFLLLSDHSVFINSMLLPRSEYPNDNLLFASNCIDTLRLRPDGGTRSLVLFIEDGRIWQRGDYNLMLQAMPSPKPEELLAFLWENRDLLWENADLAESLLAQIEEDGILAELERNDPLGQLLQELLDPWKIARGVLVLGMIGLLGYGGYSFLRSKVRPPRGTPRLSLLLDRMRPRTGLIDMRLRAGLGRGQYYERARERARAMFADLNITPEDGKSLPRVDIKASMWDRGRIRRELRRAWAIAFGVHPVRVTARDWEPFLRSLRQLSIMIQQGVVRIDPSA